MASQGANPGAMRALMSARKENLMSESVFGDLDGLLQYVECKFTLVNVVLKRARQLNNGALALTGAANPNKPVSTALTKSPSLG
jgi:hypothetical protein